MYLNNRSACALKGKIWHRELLILSCNIPLRTHRLSDARSHSEMSKMVGYWKLYELRAHIQIKVNSCYGLDFEGDLL